MILDPSDEYLINCVRNNDIEKSAILYERHFKSIYAYFFRLTRKKMESEDLAQNVFLRLIRLRSSFKVNRLFLPWLYKIAHNTYIDFCNYNNKEINILNDYRKELNETQEVEYNENQLEKFYKAFDLISPEYRELLVMSRYQGLTYKQIGEVLSLNERAVKQKAFRALEKLRKEYKRLENS